MAWPKTKIGYLAGWVSIIFNTLLFVVKFWAGYQSDSISMIADAWHTLSDSFSSIVVLLGLWFAAVPPDSGHPFGHGRAESIASIILATLLALVGMNIITSSIEGFSSPPPDYSLIAIYIFIASIFVKEGMAQVSFWAARRTGSEAIKADAWHHRSDALTTVVIVLGAVFGTKLYWLDPILGILVALILIWVTMKIYTGAINNLLGKKPHPNLLDKIKNTIEEVNPLITDIHHFKLHSYGDHKELDVDLRLPADMSVFDAHEIASGVSKAVYEKHGIRATVHVEPNLENLI